MAKTEDQFPGGRPVFIGSLPFVDHPQALEEVLRRTPETPHWVQLPARPQEGCLVQFCQGAPGLRTENGVRFENEGPGFESELLPFYEEFLAVTEGRRSIGESRFSVSREAAPGLFLLAECLSMQFLNSACDRRAAEGPSAGAENMSPNLWNGLLRGRTPFVIKGQLSGPLTVLLGIHDASGRYAYSDERLRDAVVKLLTLKARWQTEFLRQGGHRAMVFVDEPALGTLGSSAFIGVSPQAALSDLGELLSAVAQAGGWPGVHVCANADWGALLLEDLRVLSFDAFSYFDRVALFRDEIADFLGRGGMLAWGIVPTSPEELKRVHAEELAVLWRRQAETLAGTAGDVGEILGRSFITPSCGLGTLPPALALKAMDLTVAVSDLLRQRG